ncbi:hypothetical protein GcM3_084007 [Golovinomyces cichoracearum]|uniref:Uncharacterized protein n=1 Tax=Golovinomyces cichoracearum TaxID=62708 RepID=A0A420ILQ5_9PEZI|nr:hypothetical protein GcM3_084007 [Golovinomyces cichoracearum]
MKDSSLSEVLEAFIDKKQLIQRALGAGYQDDGQLRTQIITNCRGVPELEQALFDPGSTSQELFAKLRSAATIYGDQTPTGFKQETEENYQFIIDLAITEIGFVVVALMAEIIGITKRLIHRTIKASLSPATAIAKSGKINVISARKKDVTHPTIRRKNVREHERSIRIFSPGNKIQSIGTVTVRTVIGCIIFHLVDTPTHFLLSLKFMNDLRTSFDNTRNVLIKTTDTGINEHHILRKRGYAWFYLHAEENNILYLSDEKLHRLH